MEQVMISYLEYLSEGNYNKLMELFATDAQVISPLYGKRAASDFYNELLADTSNSTLTLLQTFTSKDNKQGVVNFLYEWTMKDGHKVFFDCVDVFSFDETGKISAMKIIYDTASTRPAWEEQRNNS